MNKVGYIYSLTCSNPNLIYYGSTTTSLNQRFSGHKKDFKNNKCISSKILFEWGNVKINMIEEIQYENKKELLDRESYYIRNLKCVNKSIPGRTKKEYNKMNKDKIKEYNKKYRDENQNIKRKNKIICSCGSKYSEGRFAEHKKTQKHKVYEFLKEIEDSNINLVA